MIGIKKCAMFQGKMFYQLLVSNAIALERDRLNNLSKDLSLGGIIGKKLNQAHLAQ